VLTILLVLTAPPLTALALALKENSDPWWVRSSKKPNTPSSLSAMLSPLSESLAVISAL
jgi:hypothetical protein